MTLPAALALIFADHPNKYRRERWRYARGKLDIKAQIRVVEAEGYTVKITCENLHVSND